MIDAGMLRDKAFWQASSTSKYLWTSIVNPLKSFKSKKLLIKEKKKAELFVYWVLDPGEQAHRVNCFCFITDKEIQTYSLLKQSSETEVNANFEVQFHLKEWL